ncbi:NAD+ synthase [Hydrogenobacter thermophilus]|uniref:NAD+ synthase n=1 Tax=Hydrogenobacter thermophilus TaxID=940 RepID=UPI0030FCE6DA
MKDNINVTLAQIDTKLGDIEGNAKRILQIWEEHDSVSHLVVFPELALSGYPPEDLLLRMDFLRECATWLEFIKKASEKFTSLAVIGTPFYDGDTYNSAVLIGGGRILGAYHKRFLPNYSVFDEKRYFRQGDWGLTLQLREVKLGFSVCEDIWHPDGFERTYSIMGAHVLININASPYYYGKYEFKEAFLKARAEDNLCYVVYVNLVGGQDELVFDGRSVVIDPDGSIYARAKAFEEDVLTLSLDLERVRRKRLVDTRLREGRENHRVVICNAQIQKDLPILPPRVEKSPAGEEEIYIALKTGLKAYVQKNSFEKVVLGLSGGIDSSLVACIAVDALGKDRVVGVFMPSEFTSEESREDAFALAKNLGIEIREFSIGEVFKNFRDLLGFGDFSVADENLQARIRANILFYLSNRYGWLVLSTSNKSETAVGYTTIYGDMAGGFTPLKDVYKTLVYKLARYRNSVKPDIPERVFKKPPSAELRYGQTDQDTLPPYEILDKVLSLYVEEGLSEEDIRQRGVDREIVKKVVRMVRLAEYKRKQAPIGIKVTSKAFGKDWRMPVTNAWRG